MAVVNPTGKVQSLASISGFLIDCLISDNHTYASEVTKFPVESGSTISDNIRNEPLVVVMECLVSNTPIGNLVTLRNGGRTRLEALADPLNTAGISRDPVQTAYNLILAIRAARQPVVIKTSLDTFANMALQNVSIPRESGRGDDLKFTATFQQIEIVVNRRTRRVAIVGAKAKTTFVVSESTVQRIAIVSQVVPPALAAFGFAPNTVPGQAGLFVYKAQSTSLANNADIDRARAKDQNLGQRVTVSPAEKLEPGDSFVTNIERLPPGSTFVSDIERL